MEQLLISNYKLANILFWFLVYMGILVGSGLWGQETDKVERSGKITGHYANGMPIISKAGVPALGSSVLYAGDKVYGGILGRAYLGQNQVLAPMSALTFMELFGEVGYFWNTQGSVEDPAFILQGLGMNFSMLYGLNRWIPILGMGLGHIYNQNESSTYFEPRIGMIIYHGIHVTMGIELGLFLSGVVAGWRHNLVLSLSL